MRQTLLMFILALSSIAASADKSGTCGSNLWWSYVSATKTLTISGTGTMENYDYYSVPWFSIRENIANLYIENGVKNIGSSAFQECDYLNSVTIPYSLNSIDSAAFSGCSRLTSVSIPNSVTSIGENAFSGCI